MSLSKHIIPGRVTGVPLLKMLRKGKDVRRGTFGDAVAPSVMGSSPQAALSMESISTSISRRQSGLYHWYNEQLASRPLATKAWTCFVGSVLGDALAQYATDLPFDAARNLRLSIYGLLVGGPSGHYWHAFLDARIMPKRPQSLTAVFGEIGR
eukprot:jgi/Botrbrau1/18734/Bobra.0386s0057.1